MARPILLARGMFGISERRACARNRPAASYKAANMFGRIQLGTGRFAAVPPPFNVAQRIVQLPLHDFGRVIFGTDPGALLMAWHLGRPGADTRADAPATDRARPRNSASVLSL